MTFCFCPTARSLLDIKMHKQACVPFDSVTQRTGLCCAARITGALGGNTFMQLAVKFYPYRLEQIPTCCLTTVFSVHYRAVVHLVLQLKVSTLWHQSYFLPCLVCNTGCEMHSTIDVLVVQATLRCPYHVFSCTWYCDHGLRLQLAICALLSS